MGFMDAVKSVFGNYADFSGRARRSEYWYFVLFNFLVSFALGFIGGLLGDNVSTVLSGIWSLVVLIPSLAVAWRRLHDIGRSGAYFLLILIPLVGAILLIVWFCQPGQPGDNQYGPDPKGGYKSY